MITPSQLILAATTFLFTGALMAVGRYLQPATFSVATYSILLAVGVLLLTAAVIRRP